MRRKNRASSASGNARALSAGSARLFYALCPDAETAGGIAERAGALTLEQGARWVRRENYHVTLAFVGEVAAPQIEVFRQVAGKLDARACTIEFDSLEYWPASNVVVAAAHEAPPTLTELCAALRSQIGVRQTMRLRSPPGEALRLHVTLARKIMQAPVLQAMSPIAWRARSFSLMQSRAAGGGSIYTVVDTWPLLDETARE